MGAEAGWQSQCSCTSSDTGVVTAAESTGKLSNASASWSFPNFIDLSTDSFRHQQRFYASKSISTNIRRHITPRRALLDGWRLLQMSQLLSHAEGHEYDTAYLPYEFFFEKLVDVGGA